ncbi:MAG: NADPH-dependent F420 reductase [Candidatus Binatia bacterium]|nr:NADPH-dependent F420 reductase [Candidatus Binatia bacterium]
MRVGILGGTGEAGRGVGLRLAMAGHEVRLGSRSTERAVEAVAELTHDNLSGGDNRDAASFGDVVVVAVPWESAHGTAAEVENELASRIVLSMVNAVVFIDGEPEPIVPPSGSVALGLQAQLTRSHVVAALHHVPAKLLARRRTALDFDVLTCGDNRAALDQVMGLLDSIDGLRAIDAGPLVNAAALETLTPVLIGLNLRYRSRTGLKIRGI